MIKRIIFDVDDTLIPWKKEYDYRTFSKTFEKLNIKYSKELINKLSKSIFTYEQKYDIYSKENMLNKINEDLNTNLKKEFLDEWLENVGIYTIPYKAPKEICDTLDYLQEKYELVVLTNWFKKYQERRLEKFGILKYFKEVYGGDRTKIKPYLESFENAIGDYKIEECIMIGDSINNDIKGAMNAKMNAIFLNNKKETINIENCKEIYKLSELKNIL